MFGFIGLLNLKLRFLFCRPDDPGSCFYGCAVIAVKKAKGVPEKYMQWDY